MAPVRFVLLRELLTINTYLRQENHCIIRSAALKLFDHVPMNRSSHALLFLARNPLRACANRVPFAKSVYWT